MSIHSKRLRVSDNQRFLTYDDNTPFFYLGDTAWELFHRLNREEGQTYLSNRAAKGFTVIQAVVLAELDGLNDPNPYGDTPLHNNDPTQPNEAYFQHVDYIVNQANDLGLFIGMLPTWGDKWQAGSNVFTPESAEAYGQFLGQRYKNSAIIWILGGDRNIRKESERAIIEAMAAGIKAGDEGQHLLTFHPRGPGRSSDYFHQADWLDFNMVQSSHAAHGFDNGLFMDHDYALVPPKPSLDGEPRYETIPVGFYLQGVSRYDRFTDYDARQAAYWALLAGACGHTYGNNNIWQMWQPGRNPVIDANTPWHEALDHPGAFQMSYVRRLFESRPFDKLVPNQTMILDGPNRGSAKIRAASASNGSFAFVYSPRGEAFTADLSVIQSLKVNEFWYDPRYGVFYPIHKGSNEAIRTFTPPTSGPNNDWVLVLDDAEAGLEPSL